MPWYAGLENFVRQAVPLAPMTTYRVGGAAEFFAEPPDEVSLREMLRRVFQEGLPVWVLGQGTNLLVADEGVRGLVVRLPREDFSDLKRVGCRLEVGAGHSLPALVKATVAQALRGLEFLAGVPGTLGAAVRMNAGGKYGEMGERVACVRGVTLEGAPFHWRADECGFVYRNSNLADRIVTNCALELEEEAVKGRGMGRVRAILAEKTAAQPLSSRSAGCAFKNPKQPQAHPAGRLIDEVGLKGYRVGGALVSERHANFLVCDQSAKAADLVALIREIRKRVWEERGIRLDLEIATWGFETHAMSV